MYSLTGRDIPRPVREKLKRQSPNTVTNLNLRSDHTSSHTHVFTVFDDTMETRPDSGLGGSLGSGTVSPRSSNSYTVASPDISETSPRSELNRTLPTYHQSKTTAASSAITRKEESKANNSQKGQIKSDSKVTRSASDIGANSSRSNAGQGSSSKGGPPKRGKNSAIMARAAFWDHRIIQGESVDERVQEEFPELPEDMFKR